MWHNTIRDIIELSEHRDKHKLLQETLKESLLMLNMATEAACMAGYHERVSDRAGS